MKRITLRTASLLIAISTLSILFYSFRPAHLQEHSNIVIARLSYPAYALVYIADKKKYFDEEGLNVTYRNFKTGNEAITDALAGNSDVAMAYDTPVVKKIYSGQKVSIITTLHSTSENFSLIGRRDFGITKDEDLVDKRIGVVKGSSDEYFLLSLLTSRGIQMSDITLVDVKESKKKLNLLQTGEVDAVVAVNPYIFDIKRAFPSKDLAIFQSDAYTESALLAGRRDIVRNKRDSFRKLLKALRKAELFLGSNNEEVMNIVADSLPNFSKESIKGTWHVFRPEMKLNNVLLTNLESQAQWYKDYTMYDEDIPNFRDSVYQDYLREVNPEAVTIY